VTSYHYLKPRSDQTRITTLEQIHIKATEDQDRDRPYLQPATVAQVSTLLPSLAAAYQAWQSQASAQMNGGRQATAAIKVVSRKIRVIWRVVKERTQSGELPTAVRLYYGLPANGRNPAVCNMNEWLTLADIMVQGEAQAVAVGYPPLLEPSIASLQTALATARTAVSQREAAKSAHQTAAKSLRNLRAMADELIADVMSDLRYALRKETAAHRRDIMRSYGARFSHTVEQASTIEEEPAMATAAPAAMTLPQLAAIPAVHGNGTAVHD
jgi:hypothetical protein